MSLWDCKYTKTSYSHYAMHNTAFCQLCFITVCFYFAHAILYTLYSSFQIHFLKTSCVVQTMSLPKVRQPTPIATSFKPMYHLYSHHTISTDTNRVCFTHRLPACVISNLNAKHCRLRSIHTTTTALTLNISRQITTPESLTLTAYTIQTVENTRTVACKFVHDVVDSLFKMRICSQCTTGM